MGDITPASERDPAAPASILKGPFSVPLMAELTIRRHLSHWADRLDFSTLELMPTDKLADGPHAPDLAWACGTEDGEEELLAMFVFLNEPEPDMERLANTYKLLAISERKAHYARLGAGGPRLRAEVLVMYYGDAEWPG